MASLKFKTVTVTQQEATFLEQSTRAQSNSLLWHESRVGRITASMMGTIYKFRGQRYPLSYVNSIMKYSKPSSDNISSLRYGREKEERARRSYELLMSSKHAGFSVEPCGFYIDPFLGAIPDGLVSCSCCSEKGLLEIKCPYKYINAYVHQVNDRNFYLE